jgi:hypothetical protein
MKQWLRISPVPDVCGIPDKKVVVHRSAGARTALRIAGVFEVTGYCARPETLRLL